MMARIQVCASIIALVALASVRVEAGGSAAPSPSDEQQVIATESEWVQAEVNRDAAVLDRVLDDRFLLNSRNGGTRDKASVIADVMGWRMLAQTISDRTVVVDGDTAVVFGTATFRFAVEGKDDAVSVARYTTTYVKRDGKWRAIALHMTSLEST